jgi:hypothetical protein
LVDVELGYSGNLSAYLLYRNLPLKADVMPVPDFSKCENLVSLH